MAVLATSMKLIRRARVGATKCSVTIAIKDLTGKLQNNKPHCFNNISIYLLQWSFKVKLLLIVGLRKSSHLAMFTSIGHQGFRSEN